MSEYSNENLIQSNIHENAIKNIDENSDEYPAKNIDDNHAVNMNETIASENNVTKNTEENSLEHPALNKDEKEEQSIEEKPSENTEKPTVKKPNKKRKKKNKNKSEFTPVKNMLDTYKPNKISKKGNNGNSLSAQTRAVVFNVLQFAFREKKAKTAIMDINKAMDRVAAMTGICAHTLSTINKEGSANGGVWETKVRKKRRKVITDPTEVDKLNIINKIEEFEKRNEHITLKKLHSELKQENKFSGGRSSLQIVLTLLGYKWEKNESNKKVLQKVLPPPPSDPSKSANKKKPLKRKNESLQNMPTHDFSQVCNIDESLKHNTSQLPKFMEYQQPVPMQGPTISHMQGPPQQLPSHSQASVGHPYNLQRFGLQPPDYIFNHL